MYYVNMYVIVVWTHGWHGIKKEKSNKVVDLFKIMVYILFYFIFSKCFCFLRQLFWRVFIFNRRKRKFINDYANIFIEYEYIR